VILCRILFASVYRIGPIVDSALSLFATKCGAKPKKNKKIKTKTNTYYTHKLQAKTGRNRTKKIN